MSPSIIVALSAANVSIATFRSNMGNTNQRKALRLQQAINKAGGESRATDIIEQIVSTGKPVLRYETQLNFG